jgi:hypothetical protein
MGPKFDPTEVKYVYLRAVGGEVGATSSLAPKVKFYLNCYIICDHSIYFEILRNSIFIVLELITSNTNTQVNQTIFGTHFRSCICCVKCSFLNLALY